jgi:hypothetical protein
MKSTLIALVLGVSCLALNGTCQRTTPIANRSAEHYHPNFPRLGLIGIAYDQNYEPDTWSTYAKFNVVIIGGNWEIWPEGAGITWTREDVVKGIKAASTIGTKVFQYVDYNEMIPNAESEGYDPTDPNNWFAAVNKNNWWVYENGTSGPTVPSTYSAEFTLINMTHASPADAAIGLRPYQYAAAYSDRMYHTGKSPYPSNAARSLDGFFLDNVFWAPRADGDWNRDDVTDSDLDPAVQKTVRIGERDFPDEMSKLEPHLLVLANNADWPQASGVPSPDAIAPLAGAFSGGVLEGIIGESWSVETWSGFPEAMDYYEYVMNTTKAPQLELFNQELLQPDGSDNYDSTPYRAMRYGLCMALMNNGYYAGEGQYSHTAEVSQIPWFDEYDGGGIGEGYLGQPVSGPFGAAQTHARWNYGPYGVWAREFQGGIAIMNPKGNGPQTITLRDLDGYLWKHMSGSQNPETNNGQDVTGSITLADRDGIILLRRGYQHHTTPTEVSN